MVFMYLVAIWISSFKAGIKENLVLISGITFVLVVMHLLFPIIIQTRKDFLFVIKTIFLIGIVNSVIAILLLLLSIYNISDYGIHASGAPISQKFKVFTNDTIIILRGIYANPNSLGVLLAFIFPAILFLIQETKLLRSKFLLAAGALLVGVTIFCTFSRASILSTIVVSLFFLLFYVNKDILKLAKTIMVSIILLFHSIIVFGVSLDFLRNQKFMYNIRVDWWANAIDIIQNNMLFGIGASNTVKIRPGKSFSCHNTFIEIALSFGVLALLLYSLYLILYILKTKKDGDPNLYFYIILSLLSFSILQIFETLQFGGMSIANFYLLVNIIAFLSVKQSRLEH